MPTLCLVTFNENPYGVYFAGQKLSGKVSLTTDHIKAIKGIYITLRGYAKVLWKESHGAGRTRRTVHYHAREDYFKSRVDVMGDADGKQFDLAPGKYEYNYEIDLPLQLPSSFNGHYGVIKYEVVCTINRPWAFNNTFKHPFTVISPIDLNLSTMYMLPVDRQTTKTFNSFCCCGNGGEILVKGNIPSGGFVSGQNIPVAIYIKSLSSVSCYETNACLIQMVEYRSQTPSRKSKYETRVVTINLFGPLEKYAEKELNCSLYIPSIAPTNFAAFNIIEVSYFVEIQLKTRALHTNMNIRLPITIGTVPLHQRQNMMLQGIATTSRGEASATILDAPPTYEEAKELGPVFKSDAEEDQYNQQIDYLPRYPVYNLRELMSPLYNESSVITMQPEKERY